MTARLCLARIAMAGKEKKRLHETDDEEMESTSSAPFQFEKIQKRVKYVQKWKAEYQTMFANLEKSRKGGHFAHCGFCHRDFSI